MAPQAAERGLELRFELDGPAAAGGPRRPDPAAPGAGQPGRQRAQVHRPRQRHRDRARSWPADRRAARLRFEVQDTGHRHPPGAPGRAVRAVRPGRQLDHPALWRQRPGARDLQAAGRGDGRRRSASRASRARAACSGSSCRSSAGELRPRPSAARSSRAGVRPLRVLVADDVPVNRELLAEMLGRHGHECSLAEDGGEAVALAAQRSASTWC